MPLQCTGTRNSCCCEKGFLLEKKVKFEITNTIFFGVVHHGTLCVGDTFTSDTILGYNEFDISKFFKGMLVSLESSTECDSYIFRVTPMLRVEWKEQ